MCSDCRVGKQEVKAIWWNPDYGYLYLSTHGGHLQEVPLAESPHINLRESLCPSPAPPVKQAMGSTQKTLRSHITNHIQKPGPYTEALCLHINFLLPSQSCVPVPINLCSPRAGRQWVPSAIPELPTPPWADFKFRGKQVQSSRYKDLGKEEYAREEPEPPFHPHTYRGPSSPMYVFASIWRFN